MARLGAGKLTVPEAATLLGLSVRQLRRVRPRPAVEAREGLVHRNRGRTPTNKLDAATQERIVQLCARYRDCNDQHFQEKLRKKSPRSWWRSPRSAGCYSARGWGRCGSGARVSTAGGASERKAQAGLMLLWDGSRHDGLEGRGPWLCLVDAIEDVTGELLPGAHFVAQECAAADLQVLYTIATECGVPWSLYMGQHGALKRNDDHWTLAEELRGQQDPTQVGTALSALGIEAIYALSPQAKGRVERRWRPLQDRLVSELRLANAGTVTEATAVLARYRPEHNRRCAVPARDRTAAWRPVRPGVDLARLCSFRYEATVLKDNTVRLGGTVVLDIPPGPRRRSYADARGEVRQLLDGSWRVYLADRLLATAPATTRGELRALRRRKRGRGAPQEAPQTRRTRRPPEQGRRTADAHSAPYRLARPAGGPPLPTVARGFFGARAIPPPLVLDAGACRVLRPAILLGPRGGHSP